MSPPLAEIDLAGLRAAIAAIPDPEVPVLTIEDLGILRAVDVDGERVVVTITPTYSGCPAMHHIEQRVAGELAEHGVDGEVRLVFSPAWTTEWMSAEGRRKLREYGIAPPHPTVSEGAALHIRPPVRCPRCNSVDTRVVSEFGSTACKALYSCASCDEPFDYFKEL